MKKQLFAFTALILLTGAQAVNAQEKQVIKKGNKEVIIQKDGDKETTTVTVEVDDDKQPEKKMERKESREVIISKDGDKTTKITLEINGDNVIINGKPMNEFKEDGVNIRKKKMVIVNGQPLQIEGFGNIDGKEFNLNFDGNDFGLSGLDFNTQDANEEKTDTVAFLGVQTEPAPNGVVISSVVAGSAAEKGGLSKEDIITQINGQAITDPQALTSAIRAMHPKDEVKINYLRGGKEKKVKVVLQEKIIKNQIRKIVINNRGDDGNAPQAFSFAVPNFNDIPEGFAFPKSQKLGIKIQDTENANGVKILDVEAGSSAEKAGLLPDDIIVEIGGEKITNTDEARILLQDNAEKSSYPIKAERKGTIMNFEVKIPKKLKTANL